MIYCQSIKELPKKNMEMLGNECDFSTKEVDGHIREFYYTWHDMKVTIVNGIEENKMGDHLEGLIGFLNKIVENKGIELDRQIVKRIRNTTLAVGVMCEPNYDSEDKYKRVSDIVTTIAYNTEAILFWEGVFYDEKLQPLL